MPRGRKAKPSQVKSSQGQAKSSPSQEKSSPDPSQEWPDPRQERSTPSPRRTRSSPTKTTTKPKSQAQPPRSPTPPSGSDDAASHVPSEDSERPRSPTPPPRQAKKKPRMSADLRAPQEEEMVEWLKENPMLYNKRQTDYRDKAKKAALWCDQARRMDLDVKVIKTWYDSIRTRYTKILKDMTAYGSGVTELTERQQWICDKFVFLQPYIAKCPRRNIASLKLKASASASASAASALQPPTVTEEGESDDYVPSITSSVGSLVTPSTTTTTPTSAPVLMDVRPRRDSARKEKATEERVLAKIAESRDKGIEIQSHLLKMLQAQEPATEKTAYADWCKQVMVNKGYHCCQVVRIATCFPSKAPDSTMRDVPAASVMISNRVQRMAFHSSAGGGQHEQDFISFSSHSSTVYGLSRQFSSSSSSEHMSMFCEVL